MCDDEHVVTDVLHSPEVEEILWIQLPVLTRAGSLPIAVAEIDTPAATRDHDSLDPAVRQRPSVRD